MSAKQELLELLNSANGRSYTEAQLSFGVPAVAAEPTAEFNTEVVVSGESAAGYTGTKTIKYKRLDLATAFTDMPLTSSGPETGGTLQEVLDDIFATTTIRIYPEDLSNAAAVDFTQPSITLTAAAGSYKWTGSVVVTTSVDLRDIGQEITVDTLPGFEYPTQQP